MLIDVELIPSQPNFIETLHFIRNAHSGQTDKAGVPYWMHPYRVSMHYLNRRPNATEQELIVCLLHDVVEDTTYSARDLIAMGYSPMIVTAVLLLTKENKPRKRSYLEWIDHIVESGNELAMRVKIADIDDNTDPIRVAQLHADSRKSTEKYHDALKKLLNGLKDVRYDDQFDFPDKSKVVK